MLSFLSLIIPVSFTFGFSFITDGWVSSQISYALKEGIEGIYLLKQQKEQNRYVPSP